MIRLALDCTALLRTAGDVMLRLSVANSGRLSGLLVLISQSTYWEQYCPNTAPPVADFQHAILPSQQACGPEGRLHAAAAVHDALCRPLI